MFRWCLAMLLPVVVRSAIPITIQHADLPPAFFKNIDLDWFDEVTSETFGGAISYDIGWKKIMFCDEAHLTDVAKFQYPNKDDLWFVSWAISVKIVPDPSDGLTQTQFDNYAVYGKVCQNSIIALNNWKEMSFEIDVNTLQRTGPQNVAKNWYGATTAATDRLETVETCSSTIHGLTIDMYHACGNHGGLHLMQSGGNLCEFSSGHPRTGKKIAVYLGFDANRRKVCTDEGNGQLLTIRHCEAASQCDVDINTADIAALKAEIESLSASSPLLFHFVDNKDLMIIALLVFNVMTIVYCWFGQRQSKRFKWKSVEQIYTSDDESAAVKIQQ